MNTLSFSKDLAQSLVQTQNPFPVDFDLAWQWLGYSRRNNAKRLLKHFTQGRDFIDPDFDLLNSEQKPTGQDLQPFSTPLKRNPSSDSLNSAENSAGRALQRFWLSLDCFKSLAMMAKTDQGHRVRQYFLECERILKASDLHNWSPEELQGHAAGLQMGLRLTQQQSRLAELLERSAYRGLRKAKLQHKIPHFTLTEASVLIAFDFTADRSESNYQSIQVEETMKRKAPWTDFEGNYIHDGDEIMHPSGDRGVVCFWPEEQAPSDQWRVFYPDPYGSIHSRLCLQVGDKGRAVVVSCLANVGGDSQPLHPLPHNHSKCF